MQGRAVVKYAEESPSRIPIPSTPNTPKKPRTLRELKDDIAKLKRSAAESERRFSEISRLTGPSPSSGGVTSNGARNKTRVNTAEQLDMTQEHNKRQHRERVTKAVAEPIDVDEHLDALDDDVDVWNQGRRRLSADMDFSVVGIDDDKSDCEVHNIPCGDPLCDCCTVVFSDVHGEYHDDRTLPKPLFLNSKNPQAPSALTIEPVARRQSSDSEQHAYFTSPIQQTRVGSSKDVLASYLRSRRRGNNTGVSASKSQSPVATQGKNTTSEDKAGHKDSTRRPIAEFKAKPKTVAAGRGDGLDSTYFREELTITDDTRGSTSEGEVSFTHNSNEKTVHQETVRLKNETKVDEHNVTAPITPVKPARLTSRIDTPRAPTKARPGLHIEVDQPTISPLSFQERMSRATGQITPNVEARPHRAETPGISRIGKGSRPPLSKSSCFNQGTRDEPRCGEWAKLRSEAEDYFPYNRFRKE